MPELDDILVLHPQTRAGRNKLHGRTNRWRVLATCNGGSVCLIEVEPRRRHPDIRWVELRGDPNFTWTIN